MARADVQVAQTAGLLQFTGGGRQYLVYTPSDVLYCIYVDTGSDLAFKKSTDFGMSWSAPTVIFAGTIVSFAVWYDRWSNISAGLIHLAYTETGGSDTLYRTINTESSDALSTQTTIFAGTSQAAGGFVTISRAVGGNVYCRTTIDAGAEGGFFRLPNANVPNGAWDAARTINEALSTQDMGILLPNLNSADNQDMLLIFWDISANQISRQNYDDSANSWAETIFGAPDTFAEQVAATSYPNFNAVVDLANNQHIVVAWNAIDTASQDLRCFTVTESAITAKTDVVANATDDCALCTVSLDTATGDWYVVYAGDQGGSETWLTSVNLYYKVSKDQGSTWSAQQKLTTFASDIAWIAACTRFNGAQKLAVAYHRDITLDEIMCNTGGVLPVRGMNND